MDQLTVSVHAPGNGWVGLDLSGVLDIATAAELRGAVRVCLRSFEPTEIVVNLRDVAFLDSVGIGALIGGYQEARAVGCAFVVREPRPLAHRQLEVTGLLDFLGLPAPAPHPARSRRLPHQRRAARRERDPGT